MDIARGTAKIVNTGVGKHSKLIGCFLTAFVGLLRVFKIFVKLRKVFGYTAQFLVKFTQIPFTFLHAMKFVWRRQPSQYIFHCSWFLGDPLQLVLCIKNRWPLRVGTGGRVPTGTLEFNYGRAGKKTILTPGLHLGTQALVRRHLSTYVHT